MTSPEQPQSAGVRRRLVPPLAAVTVLAVVIGGGYLIRHSASEGPGGSGAPGVLRLGDYQAPMAASAARAGSGSFRLTGELPDGPSGATVRWLTAPTGADVERLATALGLRGRLTHRGGAALYSTGAATLRVEQGPGGQWQYIRAAFTQGTIECPGNPTPPSKLDTPDLAVSCAVGSAVPPDGGPVGSGGPATVVSPPMDSTLTVTTARRARTTARPVLDAAGLDADRAVVLAGRPVGMVAADPTVADLPTQGLTTSVTVVGTQVNAAAGWLGGSRAGATYPVISAKAAWKQLVSTSMERPAIGCAKPLPPEGVGAGASTTKQDPMVCGGPIMVTGARFGLSLHEDGGRPLLVPSWLFDVRGSDNALSVVAVDPRYLASPPAATATDDSSGSSGGGSSSSGSGSSGSGSSGSTGSGSAGSGSVNPGGPAVGVTINSPFSSVTTGPNGTSLLVQFAGGVPACYAYSVVPTETKHQVTMALVEKTTSTSPCPDLAKVYERRIPLAGPLGTRQVVDARTGAVLLGPTR